MNADRRRLALCALEFAHILERDKRNRATKILVLDTTEKLMRSSCAGQISRSALNAALSLGLAMCLVRANPGVAIMVWRL